MFSLGGAPGVRSRRWAGATGSADAVDAANNAELLRRLRGAPEARRRARYRCVLVYLREPDAVPRVFEGVCGGRILEAPRGEGGFGYDPLFFSDELGRTFGEATAEEKDAVSHRGRALAIPRRGRWAPPTPEHSGALALLPAVVVHRYVER